MQLGAKLPGSILVARIVHGRRKQFPKITLTDTQRDVVALIGEFRHVERITAERDQRRIAFADFEALEITVFQNQKRATLVLHHRAMIGDDADAFVRIAAVVDEDSGEQATGLPLANPNRQVLIELREAAGLQNVGEHVGGDVGVPLLQPPHAVRGEIGGDKSNQ